MTIETQTDPELHRSRQVAQTAAQAAGVQMRELSSLTELTDVVQLYISIWGENRPPASLELLRALTKAGNYVGGAYAGERLVGACVGFFHQPSDDALHSHLAGVSSEYLGRSVGFALKLHQRAWAMERGVADIAWTYDPLISRNAHFNLSKLGARAVEYLPNFYGPMADRINGTDDSDRLLVRWAVRPSSPAPVGTEDAITALGIGPDGEPRLGALDAEVSFVCVPRDIGAIRRDDPALAHRWRRAVRDALGTLLQNGSSISGFDRSGRYVVTQSPKGSRP
jgi:predicted GNAT superfamily acetyltransferase